MSSPFDSAHRSDERPATTGQEIAPAAEIRAYLARHGGPSEPARAVTPVAAEPTPPATSEIVSEVKAEPETTVVEPAPLAFDPAAVVVEDAATELPIVAVTPATAPAHVEPAEPAAPESISINSPASKPAMSEPERITPESEPIAAQPEPAAVRPEPIAPEPQIAAVVSTVPEPPVSDITATPANANNIDVIPERVTNTAPPRETAAPSRGPQVDLPFYLLALTTVLALGTVAYQTYLLRQSLNIIDRASQRMDHVQQQNEYVRACRDLSDAYFLVKQRVAPLMAVPDRSNIAGAARISEINRIEAQDAVAHFAALGAFLGNAQDAAARERYAELSRVLTRLAEDAKGMPLTEFDKAFEPADKLFVQVNSDCARVSQFPKT